MYDPHKYLNHNRAKSITLINVAINAVQARKNFFDPISNILKTAGEKAFRQFGFDPDEDILSTQIVFPNNIEIMSANSRAGGIEGYDILLAMADEVDDVEFYGVEKIVNTLRTSAQSRFGGKEKVIVISYRRYEGSSGKILEYYNRYKDLAHVYARRYASWDFHPVHNYDKFEEYFKENPEKAGCMYGSEESGSFVDSWIKDPKRIKASMNLEREWIFDWDLPYQTLEVGSKAWWDTDAHDEWKQNPMSEHSFTRNGEKFVINPYDIPIKKHGIPGQKYVLCGDPALGSDANGGDGYGLTLAHREIVKDDKGRKFPRPIIDFSFRFTGRMFEEKQVQMNAVEQLIKKLKDEYGYDIRIFSFDGWNCLAEGSKVLTTSGYKEVENLSEGDGVLGKNGINYVETLEQKSGVPTYIVKTDNGLEIEVTRNHPFLVKDKGFVQAEVLTIGDRILHGDSSVFGDYENIPEALVLGYLIAEGDWNHNIRFSNLEEEVKDDFYNSYKSLYSDVKIYKYEKNVRTNDKRLLNKLCESGAHNKKVPSSVFSGTKEHIGAFLSGLYEGYGNVQIEKVRKNGQKVKVELTTVSEALSKDVQLLLSQLGIKSYRKYYKNKWFNGKRTPYYRITISGRQILLFQEKVGFRSSRKINKLKEAVSKLKYTRQPRFIDSAKVIDIQESTSNIVHMEVSGDNTYVAENLVNHNSASLTQWISKTYPNTIVHDRNLVETADYTALRDSIFGQAAPSSGQGEKETNGGIDWPWHPIVYEEARNLKEDRTKPKVKIDHPANGTKDIIDTIAKATRIILYQWPFQDIMAAGTTVKEVDLEKRLNLGVASQEESSEYYEKLYSNSVGMGQWKDKAVERPITYDELFND